MSVRRPTVTRRRVALAAVTSLGAATAMVAALPQAGARAAPAPAAPPAAPAPAPASARPNILFFLIDDMGFGDLSATGNKLVATPNMDRLAREGVLMTQYYDAAPICSASRGGYFSGRFSPEVGFTNYIHGHAADAATGQVDWLDPRLPNVARAMHDAGYVTGHFGKWHMGGTRDIRNAPAASAYGFDESFTNEGGGPNGSSPAEGIPKPQKTAAYVDKTLDFINRHAGKGKPWYVDFWTNDVHEPWRPSPQQEAAIRNAGRSPLENKYFASLVNMDREFGRLVDTLRQRGQLNNTIIVITSDNGPTSRIRYAIDGAPIPGSTGVFRGRKNSLYEGGTRQPLIVWWPGHVKAGTRDNTTVAQAVDLFPTLAAIAGAKAPANADGINLWSAWQGTPITKRPDVFWQYGAYGPYNAWTRAGNPHDRSPGFAIRQGPWKLLAEGNGSGAQLYNIPADPSETHDLAQQQPAIARAMTQRLVAWVQSLPTKPSLSPPTDVGVPGNGGGGGRKGKRGKHGEVGAPDEEGG